MRRLQAAAVWALLLNAAGSFAQPLDAVQVPVADEAVRKFIVPESVPLWADGAPGSADRRSEPERIEVIAHGSVKVYNIHNPSVTPYLPEPGKATGAAVILMPGGGHRELNVSSEGYLVGEFLRERGVAGFVLKYRLSGERGSPYQMSDALADARRAVRLVRSHATEWGVDPDRIGVAGFSAGGQLAMVLAQEEGVAAEPADEVDRLSARPDFQILIYPGSPNRIAPDPKTPPTFMAAGYRDRIALGLAAAYPKFVEAGVAAELHLYADAGHPDGFRPWDDSPANQYHIRMFEWIGNQGFLEAKPKP